MPAMNTSAGMAVILHTTLQALQNSPSSDGLGIVVWFLLTNSVRRPGELTPTRPTASGFCALRGTDLLREKLPEKLAAATLEGLNVLRSAPRDLLRGGKDVLAGNTLDSQSPSAVLQTR